VIVDIKVYQGLVVEFLDYWAGLTSKSLSGSSGSSGVERPFQVYLQWKEVLLVIVDIKVYQGLAVEFLDYWAGLTSKSLSGSSGSSGVERPFQVYLQWKEVLLLIIDIKRYPGWAVEFQDVWTCLAFKSLGGRREAASFVSAVSAWIHLKDWYWISLDKVLAVELLNFRTIEPVSHSSRWVWKWKRPV